MKTTPKHLHNLTDDRKSAIVQNWTYQLIGAKSDLRRLPINHHNRSYALAQIRECEEKLAYFQALRTVEDKARSRAAQREKAKKAMNRAHDIQRQALLIWGAVEFSECLRAAWKEVNTGAAFQIVTKHPTLIPRGEQIFFTLYKMRGVAQVASKLLTRPVTLNSDIFQSWANRGVILPQENKFVLTARIEAQSWQEFLDACTETEKTALHHAEVQAHIDATMDALTECRRQHRPAHDLEEKLYSLRAALTV
jgi:hypothetical protein